jgi:hypothetical protein
VSIVSEGRTHLDLWATTWGLVSVAMKHGGERFHNVYGIGVRPSAGKPRWATILGFGLHFPLSDSFYLDTDLVVHSLHSFDDAVQVATVGEIRVPLGLRLDRRFALYAGPAYSLGFAGTAADAALGPTGIATIHDEDGLAVRGWPGAVLGVQGL